MQLQQEACTMLDRKGFSVGETGGPGGGSSGHGMLGALGMPFVRGANLRASSSTSGSPSSYSGVGAFANSPVNGLLYMRGKIGACALHASRHEQGSHSHCSASLQNVPACWVSVTLP